jgi:hypothetical protein
MGRIRSVRIRVRKKYWPTRVTKTSIEYIRASLPYHCRKGEQLNRTSANSAHGLLRTLAATR